MTRQADAIAEHFAQRLHESCHAGCPAKRCSRRWSASTASRRVQGAKLTQSPGASCPATGRSAAITVAIFGIRRSSADPPSAGSADPTSAPAPIRSAASDRMSAPGPCASAGPRAGIPSDSTSWTAKAGAEEQFERFRREQRVLRPWNRVKPRTALGQAQRQTRRRRRTIVAARPTGNTVPAVTARPPSGPMPLIRLVARLPRMGGRSNPPRTASVARAPASRSPNFRRSPFEARTAGLVRRPSTGRDVETRRRRHTTRLRRHRAPGRRA